jgi:hypothetical protein
MTSSTQEVTAAASRPRAIPFDEIEWRRPEWADPESQALVALVEGYEFEIGPGERKTWDWAVKATSEVSETPEVIVAGTAKSKSGAQYSAKEQFNQHRLREWQRSRGVEPKTKVVLKAPKAKTEQPVPTEAQMAGARKFVANQLARSGPKGAKQPAAA